MVAIFKFKTDRVPSWHIDYDAFKQRKYSAQWTRFPCGNCPICQGQRKDNDCRQSPGGIVHCRGDVQAPSGWRFIGEDAIGFGMYAEATDNANSRCSN